MALGWPYCLWLALAIGEGPPASPPIILANRHFRIQLNGQTGALRGLENLVTGRPATPLGRDLPLVSVVVKSRGLADATRWDHPQAVCAGLQQPDPRTAVVPLGFLDGKLQVLCRIQMTDGPLSLWQCTVTNGTDRDVIRVRFPILTDVRIGEDAADDELILPRQAGACYRNPARQGCQTAKYLGTASMPWLDLYDRQGGGVYLAALDPDLTNLLLSATANAAGDAVELALEKCDAIPPGQSRTWTYAVALHEGDWHWAADQYRQWFYEHFARPSLPAWLAEADGFYHVNLTNRQGWRFSQLPTLLEEARAVGLHFIHCWGQSGGGGDGGAWCFPWPSPLYGSAEEFAAGNRAIRQRRGHIGYGLAAHGLNLYDIVTSRIDGQVPKALYPPQAPMPTARLFLENQLVADPTGKPAELPTDRAGPDTRRQDKRQPEALRDWRLLRPWAPAWQEYNRRWAVDIYLRQFGAHGLCWQGMAAIEPQESFDRRLGDNGVGRWAQGHLQLLKRIHDEVRQWGEPLALGVEGCGDAYGQYAWQRISGLAPHAEVFRYALPDQVCFAGYNPSGADEPEAVRDRVHLYGLRFDMAVGYKADRDLLKLRQATRPWIYPGRFMDTVGLQADEGLRACWFLLDTPADRAAAVTLVNERRSSGPGVTLDSRPFGPVRWAVALDEEGGVEPWPIAGDALQVRFAAPRSARSVVLLVNRVSGQRANAGRIDYDTTGPHPVARVRFVRLGPAAKLRLRLQDTPALRCEQAYVEFQAAPGRRFEHVTRVEPTLGFRRVVPLEARIESEVDVTLLATQAAPPVVDGGFELAPADREPARYLHGIDATTAADGKQSLRLNPDPALEVCSSRELYLEPNRSYVVSLQLRKTGQRARLMGGVVVEHRGWQDLPGRHTLRPAGPPNAHGWQRHTAAFTTDSTADRWTLRLYNAFSQETVWFDDIVVSQSAGGPSP